MDGAGVDAGDHGYAFAHPLTRDAAYQLMPPTVRALAHQQAADALEARGGAVAAEVAEHLHAAIANLGGYRTAPAALLARELQACLAGALTLAEQYRHEDAVRLCRRACGNPAATAAERNRARLLEADNWMNRGRFDLAESLAAEAVTAMRADPAGGDGTPARFTAMLGLAQFRVGKIVLAGETLRAAIAQARETGDTRAERAASGNLSSVLYHVGRIPEAVELLERVLELARDSGDRRVVGMALGNLAVLVTTRGEHARSEQLSCEALAIARETGNIRSEGIVSGALASHCARHGRLAEAEAYAARVIAIAHQIGDRYALALANGAFGEILQRQGRLGEARTKFEEAVELNRGSHNPRGEGTYLIPLALVMRALGDAAAAEALLRRSVALLRSVGDTANEAAAIQELIALVRQLRPGTPETEVETAALQARMRETGVPGSE